MTVAEFERVLRAFADDALMLDVSSGKVSVEIRDEVVEATVERSRSGIYVIENGDRLPAARWLTLRIARLPVLADRILANVDEEPSYVVPRGKVLGRINDPGSGGDVEVEDAGRTLLQLLEATAGATNVHYLTAEAGVGKTTAIEWMAREQAKRFKRKDSQWLLVPIRLGGQTFVGFDDVLIADMASRIRFPTYYYDAFLALVRMGVVVPAFDGFEEVFVERGFQAAAYALGRLIHDLESSGSILVAARKAYFEYPSLRAQARLTDAVSDRSVDYARTRLDPWKRDQFLAYAASRAVSDGPAVYQSVKDKLGSDHPLLTKAFFAGLLLDVFDRGDADALFNRLEREPTDYYRAVVESVVAREAEEEWVETHGNSRWPLLSSEEHHLLLAEIAGEMWWAARDALPKDYLESIAESFATKRGKKEEIVYGVEERVTSHSLLVRRGLRYGFSHEHLRSFYVGEALAQMLVSSSDVRANLDDSLRKTVLPGVAADAAVAAVKRMGADPESVLTKLRWLVGRAHPASYAVENAGALAIRVLELLEPDKPIDLVDFVFPRDGLKGRQLGAVRFERCCFYRTSLDGARLGGCRFVDCTMHGLRWSKGFMAAGAAIEGGSVVSVAAGISGNGAYSPAEVRRVLRAADFRVKGPPDGQEVAWVEPDGDTMLAEQALRSFLRATHVGEDVFRRHCRERARRFFGTVLPRLIDAGILNEVEGDRGRRYRLQVPMRAVAAALPAGVETLDKFVESIINVEDE